MIHLPPCVTQSQGCMGKLSFEPLRFVVVPAGYLDLKESSGLMDHIPKLVEFLQWSTNCKVWSQKARGRLGAHSCMARKNETDVGVLFLGICERLWTRGEKQHDFLISPKCNSKGHQTLYIYI
jgi:hypothetical protein